MKRFGPSWNTPADEVEECEAPIGELCAYCTEPIEEDDSGFMVPHGGETWSIRPWHRECLMRQTTGGLAHQEKKCRCYGGAETDETLVLSRGMTLREEAREAVRRFYMQHHE